MEKRFLGLDYGLKRVGVAISYGSLAEPLVVLPNNPQLTTEISKICQKFAITDLVIGVSERETAWESQSWGESLAASLSLPAHFEDETLTSRIVQRKMKETRVGKAQYQGHIDHYAAALILQEYLEHES